MDFPNPDSPEEKDRNTEKHEVKMRPECSTTAYKKTFTEGNTTVPREQRIRFEFMGLVRFFYYNYFI